jgi:hypothetical protein
MSIKTTSPLLTFFCELEPEALHILFSDPELFSILKRLNASLSLGIIDLSLQRAEIVKQLNRAGIPVTAWLLLPKEEGYWFNIDNASCALRRFMAFKTWSAHHNLQWSKIGLDIEPDLRLMEKLSRQGWPALKQFLAQSFNQRRLFHASIDYRILINQIRLDGHPVESYQFPLIQDERSAGSNLLQTMTGILDLPVDREVLMLYTSFNRQYGLEFLQSYAQNAQGIAIGVTGGGIILDNIVNPQDLTWEEFQRDLLISSQNTPYVYIFSLEGCVRHGFLPKLLDFDWEQPKQALLPINRVSILRKIIRPILWFTAHPWLLLTFLLGFILWKRRK